MSKTAEAWARIHDLQVETNRGIKEMSIMLSSHMFKPLFGKLPNDYPIMGVVSIVTIMGPLTLYFNNDLDPDELIVL